MARWGNALGGWRKQKRDARGRWGSGSSSARRAYVSAKKASKSQRKIERKKAIRKHNEAAKKIRKTTRIGSNERAEKFQKLNRSLSMKKARIRVDHQDRMSATRKSNKKGYSAQKRRAAYLAVGVAAAYGAYRLNEARLDRGSVVLYHNTPADVALKVIAGRTDLRGSDYRQHISNMGPTPLEKLFSSGNTVSGLKIAAPADGMPLPKSPALNFSARMAAENKKMKNPVHGNPVFFTNKHRGVAREHYGSAGWMVRRGSKLPIGVTLKARYTGPLEHVQYDDWHFDNKSKKTISSIAEVNRHSRRKHAASTGNLGRTANPRGGNRRQPVAFTSENYFMIPENIVKEHTKYSIAGVKAPVTLRGVVTGSSPFAATAIMGAVGHAGNRAAEVNIRKDRRWAAAKKAGKTRAQFNAEEKKRKKNRRNLKGAARSANRFVGGGVVI